MCKVFAVAGITPKTAGDTMKLVKEMAKIMGTSDSDGVGYAAITKNGDIYGEKWLKPADAFVIHANPKPDPVYKMMKSFFDVGAKFKDEPANDLVYERFGALTKKNVEETVAVILHARNSTVGAKVLINTHPFVELGTENVPQTALIHNGGIVNHDKLTKKSSTCDSEVLLHEYIANHMWYNPWAITQLAKTVVGTYAVGVLSSIPHDKTGPLVPVLDIFKSNRELHAGYVPELGTMVFSTADHQLKNGIEKAGMTIKNIVELQSGFLFRINAITGERLEELIPFELSQLREYGNYSSGYPPSTNTSASEKTANTTSGTSKITPVSIVRPMGPPKVLNEAETAEEVKANFEKNHLSVFNQPYYDVKNAITPEEKAFYAELDKGTDTDYKALRLVKHALNLG